MPLLNFDPYFPDLRNSTTYFCLKQTFNLRIPYTLEVKPISLQEEAEKEELSRDIAAMLVRLENAQKKILEQSSSSSS